MKMLGYIDTEGRWTLLPQHKGQDFIDWLFQHLKVDEGFEMVMCEVDETTGLVKVGPKTPMTKKKGDDDGTTH
jgi:hypothetical protein